MSNIMSQEVYFKQANIPTFAYLHSKEGVRKEANSSLNTLSMRILHIGSTLHNI